VSRFSDQFNLSQSQAELDFVDIPIDTDIALFCDPYSFVIEEDPWFAECNNEVLDFFQRLLDLIRRGDEQGAMRMLEHVGEANEAHLGFSKGQPRGLGIGRNKATDLYNRLAASTAVKTGKLRDLSDCDLFIPGIGADNISDMTLNIIRHKLLEYTAVQCAQLGVLTSQVQGGFQWDSQNNRWRNGYAHLPVAQGNRLMLVPKAAVRYRLALEHQEFYDKHVLQFLQAENLSANSSLVETLRNGKRRVTKKALKEIFPVDKDMLFKFSEEHPEVLEAYKNSASERSFALRDEQIEEGQRQTKSVNIDSVIAKFDQIQPGHADANKFHDAVLGALTAIFYPQLRMFTKEREVNGGRKRVDIVANNSRTEGFFSDLSSQHDLLCPYIFFECKNYSQDPANPEFDQLSGRLNDQRGRVGILVCRKVENRAKTTATCRDFRRKGELILVLDDEDLHLLLGARKRLDEKAISEHMHLRLRQIEF